MSEFFVGIAVGSVLVVVLVIVITRTFGPGKREVDRAILKLFRRD